MSNVSDCPSAADWEARQRHASFWQQLLNQRQTAAIAFVSLPGILITIGLAVTRFSDVKSGDDWMILYAFLVGWLLMSGWITSSYARSAKRIERSYCDEHLQLFPDAVPYRLESYLLDRDEKKRRRELSR